MIRTILAASLLALPAAAQQLELEQGDRICIVGSSLAERMQHDGWLEARLQLRFPELGLVFRNLGFAGDEIVVRQRTAGFGTPDEHLTRCRASVVVGCFGFNESFDGEAGLERFGSNLRDWITHVRATSYDGQRPPRIVLVTPVAFDLPDHELLLSRYTEAVVEVAGELDVPCVDVYRRLPTVGRIFLTEDGNRQLAETIEEALFGDLRVHDADALARVRVAVVDKNRHWFLRYRTPDGFNVYGGRSKLSYEKGLDNFTVLQRELEILDVMTANRDRAVHAAARGEQLVVDDSNTPEPIPVETNLPGDGPDGAHVFLSGEDAIAKMHPGEGMEVTLFASEADFPELVNPVQMAFDTRGRLWVAAWPTYTHWTPKQPARDALLILEDTDGDGRADRRTNFAGDLYNPTGFEFWNGGVIVAQAPDLWFLEDTDGDDVADRRTRILHGLSSADTHHSANSFVIGGDGALYFGEGTFHMSQPESPFGPVRNHNGCIWRFEPRTGRVERFFAANFPNPHGHVATRYGQHIVYDGTTARPFHALMHSGHLDGAAEKHPFGPTIYERRTRPSAATEILSSPSFEGGERGDVLVANVIGFRGIQRYRIETDGASFRGEEVEPIVFSDDPNFRPVDIEVGPDGAIWFLDWHNPLIGHMQHHIRDPNRDNTHGRVYRIACSNVEPPSPVPIDGVPTEDLVDLLLVAGDRALTDRERYRIRIELSERPTEEVIARATMRTSKIPFGMGVDDDRWLEALWLHQQHEVVDELVLDRALRVKDPRVRAAAVRVVRCWRDRLPNALERLRGMAADADPLVRCEVVVATSFFRTPEAAEIAIAAASAGTDRYIDFALRETLRQLEPFWREALASGEPFAVEHPDAVETLLDALDADTLAALPPSVPVVRRVLMRADTSTAQRADAVRALASLDEPPDLVEVLDGSLDPVACFAALIATDGGTDRALELARGSRKRTRAFLEAVPKVDDRLALGAVRPAIEDLVREAAAIPSTGARGRFVRVELPRTGTLTLAEVEVFAGGVDVARDKDAAQSTTAWNGVAGRAVDGDTDGRFGANTSTHTNEDSANPWWEVDLGGDFAIDRIVVWNRVDGTLGERLDGFTLSVLDAERDVAWQRTAVPAPAREAAFDVDLDPSSSLRQAADAALAHLGSDDPRLDPTVLALGAEVYRRDAHCVTCHQENGRGLPGLYPPLVGTRWVIGDEARLIKLVLHGMWGDLELDGVTYKAPPMPPMTPFRDLLNDAEIAAVLTYVRNSWGNRAPAVTEETVRGIRAAMPTKAGFWNPRELLEQHPFK